MSVHAVFPGESLILCTGVRRQGVNGNIRRVGPREAYITHMSHEIGLHAATETMLPEGVHLAYDTLEIEINEQYENTQG